jgi:hypothetical protein
MNAREVASLNLTATQAAEVVRFLAETRKYLEARHPSWDRIQIDTGLLHYLGWELRSCEMTGAIRGEAREA